jgi:hypothetical protein
VEKSPHASHTEIRTLPRFPIRGVINLPFAEQIEFFRQKLNLPTDRWDDIQHEMHDRSFVVAGAKKADLLDDLRQAVDKALDKGTGLEAFRKDFRKIVAERGWHGWTGEGTTGGEAWRTRVIWETNLASSYAAGRYAQLTDPELLARRPYWKYVHADGVMNPRPQHLAWNGLVLRHDHPFWKTHYPPNGWGCHCRVVAVREPKDGDLTTPPEGWDQVDEKTGRLPGIDKGWAYAPGKSVADELRTIVEQKAAKLPEELARPFVESMQAAGVLPSAPVTLDDFIRAGAEISRVLPDGGQDVAAMHQALMDGLMNKTGRIAALANHTGGAAGAAVRQASALFPASWVDAAEAAGKVSVKNTQADRAWFDTLRACLASIK